MKVWQTNAELGKACAAGCVQCPQRRVLFMHRIHPLRISQLDTREIANPLAHIVFPCWTLPPSSRQHILWEGGAGLTTGFQSW